MVGGILFSCCPSIHYILVLLLILLNNSSEGNHYLAGVSYKHCLLTLLVQTEMNASGEKSRSFYQNKRKKKHALLALKMLSKFVVDNNLKLILLFFRGSKASNFA